MTSNNLEQIVYGEIRHARLQQRREQYNPLRLNGKNRRVLNAFPEDLVAPADSVHDLVPVFTQPGNLELLRQQLREVVRQPEYLELLNLVLFEGMSIRDAAESLILNYSTARTVVARTKRWLKGPIRRRNGKK